MRFIDFVRWVIYIPAGFLGGALIAWLLMLPVVFLTESFGGQSVRTIWVQVPVAVIQGVAAMFTCAYIAPSENKQVPSIVAVSVFSVLCLLAAWYNLSGGDWLMATGAVSGGIAAILAVMVMGDDGDSPFLEWVSNAFGMAMGALLMALYIGMHLLLLGTAIAIGIAIHKWWAG